MDLYSLTIILDHLTLSVKGSHSIWVSKPESEYLHVYQVCDSIFALLHVIRISYGMEYGIEYCTYY